MERDLDTLTRDLFEGFPQWGKPIEPAISQNKKTICPDSGQNSVVQRTGPALSKSQPKIRTMNRTEGGQTIACWKGPLKGKGVDLRQWLRLAEDRLADVHRQMIELRDETKMVDNRQASLDIYYLKHRDQRTLRWRLSGGRHATWELVRPLLKSMNATDAQGYIEWNERAMILNVLEQSARYEMRSVQRLIAEWV